MSTGKQTSTTYCPKNPMGPFLETNKMVFQQELFEQAWSKHHLDAALKEEFKHPQTAGKLRWVQEAMKSWIQRGFSYSTKRVRWEAYAVLNERSQTELLLDVACGLASCVDLKLVAAVGKTAMRMQWVWANLADAALSVAEILSFFADADLCDISRDEETQELRITHRLPLSDKFLRFAAQIQVLPPMLCPPMLVTHNFASGYLLHNTSVVLNSNHHLGEICLDVLNLMNQQPLALSTPFLKAVDQIGLKDLPKSWDDLPNSTKREWLTFLKECAYFYRIYMQVSRFWFNYRLDARGRAYPEGYHLNPQGNSFRRSCLELPTAYPVTTTPDF